MPTAAALLLLTLAFTLAGEAGGSGRPWSRGSHREADEQAGVDGLQEEEEADDDDDEGEVPDLPWDHLVSLLGRGSSSRGRSHSSGGWGGGGRTSSSGGSGGGTPGAAGGASSGGGGGTPDGGGGGAPAGGFGGGGGIRNPFGGVRNPFAGVGSFGGGGLGRPAPIYGGGLGRPAPLPYYNPYGPLLLGGYSYSSRRRASYVHGSDSPNCGACCTAGQCQFNYNEDQFWQCCASEPATCCPSGSNCSDTCSTPEGVGDRPPPGPVETFIALLLEILCCCGLPIFCVWYACKTFGAGSGPQPELMVQPPQAAYRPMVSGADPRFPGMPPGVKLQPSEAEYGLIGGPPRIQGEETDITRCLTMCCSGGGPPPGIRPAPYIPMGAGGAPPRPWP